MKDTPKPRVLKQACEELLRHNEVLRTALFEGENFAEQKVTENCSVDLPFHDLYGEADPADALDKLSKKLQREKLHLESGRVTRFALTKIGRDRWSLIFIIHHLALDRGGSKKTLEQVALFYDQCLREESTARIKFPQYVDFTLWHNEQLQLLSSQVKVDSWSEFLADAPAEGPLLPCAVAKRGK